jgi:uncharacterized protein YwqG
LRSILRFEHKIQGAVEMSVVALRRTAHESKIEASVILRRQVPIRFGETARSWFGGLPQMPRTVAWPRASTNGAALNFIAQICCADLPKQLWGGRGPRDGWLLLFADYRQLNDSEDDDSLVQVLHTNRLGPERSPPGQTFLRSVMNRLTTSADDDGAEDANKPPVIYRRWPIDIVVQNVPPLPPAPENEWDWEWCPLPFTLEELYGAPVDDRTIGDMARAEPRPRTWRAALHMVEELINHFKVHEFPRFKENDDGSWTKLEPERICHALNDPPKEIPSDWKPGWLEKVKAKAAASLAGQLSSIQELEAWLDEQASERSTSQRERLADARQWLPHGEAVIAGLAPYTGADGEVALAKEIERDFKRHANWVVAMRVVLAEMGAHIRKHRLDADLPDGEWQALKAKLMSETTEYWSNCYGDGSAMWRHVQSLFDFGKRHIGDEPREGLLDTYTRSAASQVSIPPEIRAELEPKLRYTNVPHRMGGPCDPIQGSATPDDGDMLFQIASDEAMGWVWADLGTLCVYVDPADLKARRFGQVSVRLEGG